MVMIHAGALLALLPIAHPTLPLLLFCALTYAVRMFAITAGYHRYFAHHAFKTSRPIQFLFAFVGGMAVLRGALWWAAHHRAHHKFSDKVGDPHSPVHGLWWSHAGWFMARGNQETRGDLIPDLLKYPELVWLNKHEIVPIVIFVLGCLATGAAWGHYHGAEALESAFAFWVWGANVSSVLVCQSMFSLNSASHALGTRRYDVDDESTNNFPIALATFGEGWHNNHHRWPNRAFLGEKLWEIDISWYGIKAMRAFGLVYDVRDEAPKNSKESA
ncbi:MAG: stearoyl-CoA desaturase (delta-9 desaturase) [Planctomycetota bacterium]|jgi:stearoyl-CoA desaturase (delta-9 desaturase)